MRILISAAFAASIAASPAIAQVYTNEPGNRPPADSTTHSQVIIPSRDEGYREPYESDFTRWDRADRESRNSLPVADPGTRYRKYDWDRPEPGRNGYFADDYRSPFTVNPKPLKLSDRVYRGRDARYYCRRWDGTTMLIEAGESVLGDRLAVGGSQTLRVLAAADAGVADAIARRDLRCGGVVVISVPVS